jgi:hypothetical protein
VSAKHRVVAALDCELVPEKMPESVTLWQSHLENGRKGNHGEWMPANGAEPAHLKTVPYTLPAKDDRKQRTIHTLSMPVSQGDHPPVILQPETKIRVRGKIASSHRIWFGMTLSRENGDFAGRFQITLPAEKFQSGELQAGAGQPAGKPRPEVEKPEKPDPIEEYRRVEKWLKSHKAEAAKAERDLEVKIAELRKQGEKHPESLHEVEMGIKRLIDKHNAFLTAHAGEAKNLEGRWAEAKNDLVEKYRRVEKALAGNKAWSAKAERDLEVKIAEANKNPDKREVEIQVKDLVAEHDAAMKGHAGETKYLEDRLAELKKIPEVAELKEPFEVVLNLSDYHLDPALAQWADSLPKTPYGLIVKGVWCHTLWDPAGLQVSEIELMTPTGK